jgi:YegS/Rv2252/BmrU family lipid kinase
VIIGGDGSLNEAVNGICDLKHTALGFVPCGTGNDMCRDMAIPDDSKALVERIMEGGVKHYADIGETTFYGEDGSVKVRRFNISSDIGFGAASSALVNKSKLKPILNRFGLGRAIYPVEAIKVCFTAKPAAVKLRCGGKTRLYKKCLCAIVMNHCHEGGGFKFCPNADFSDGLFDVCVGNGLGKLAFLRMLPFAYKGTHLKLPGIYEQRGESIVMTSDVPLWVHTDGEVLGRAKRVEIRMLPEKLRLLI